MNRQRQLHWLIGCVIAVLAAMSVSDIVIQTNLDSIEKRLVAHHDEQMKCIADAERVANERLESHRPMVTQRVLVSKMIPWCQSKDDFLVTTGRRFVSFTSASSRPGKLNLKVYVPPGNHRLKYACQETWDDAHQPQQVDLRKTDPRRWDNIHDLSLPIEAVHEINFQIESDENQTRLLVDVTGGEEKRYTLNHSKNDGFSTGPILVIRYPNETLRNWNDDGTSDFERLPLNEIVNHDFSLHAWSDKKTRGGVAVRCWLESDAPRVLEAHHVAASHDWMIAPEDNAEQKFGQLFEPYQSDGVFRLKPQLPK